ncbi:hypothetical protein [Embleya sp. NPDC005971]|uniref:hypothetical protein n=1 Tax=Embleya sp. NPDC005971 TaxID=3156724 RepID=UPI0033E7B87A
MVANPAVPGAVLLRVLSAAGHEELRRGFRDAPGLPRDVVEVLLAHPDQVMRAAVAANPYVDAEQRGRLVHDRRRVVLANLFGFRAHPDGEPKPLPDAAYEAFFAARQWANAARQDQPYDEMTLLDEMGRCRSMPHRLRLGLARHPQPGLRRFAARFVGGLSAEDRAALLADPDPDVRAEARKAAEDDVYVHTEIDWNPENWGHSWVFSGRLVERGTMERVVRGENCPDHYRSALAGNPHLPPDLVAVLARDEDPDVRDAVSLRPELTEEERAAIDYRVPELTDLDEVAWHPYRAESLPVAGHARSAHPVLRRYAACAPGVADGLRDVLLGDSDLGVRVLTCRHQAGVPSGDLLRAYREFRGRNRWRLTYRPGFPTHGLARFADDPDPAMRELVVLDPQAPAAVVVGLLADPERCVRTTLARHPAVPVDRLVALLDDAELGPYAARNPALPVEVMHRILDVAGVPRGG